MATPSMSPSRLGMAELFNTKTLPIIIGQPRIIKSQQILDLTNGDN
jgi:hypothetical protein